MLRLSCSCGKVLKIDDKRPGKQVRCPECGTKQRVPAKNRRQPAIAAGTRLPLLVVCGAAALLLLVVAAGVWLLVSPNSSASGANAGAAVDTKKTTGGKPRAVAGKGDHKSGTAGGPKDTRSAAPPKPGKTDQTSKPVQEAVKPSERRLAALVNVHVPRRKPFESAVVTELPLPVKKPYNEKPDSVAVKFWLPKKVGDIREVEFVQDFLDKTTDTVGGSAKQAPRTNSGKQLVQGKIATLAVDGDGRESKVEFAIATLRNTLNGKVENLLGDGAVLVPQAKPGLVEVKHKGGNSYDHLIGGNLLRKTANLPLPGTEADEIGKIFGTDQRKAVGDTWEGDKEVLAGLLNKNPNGAAVPKDVIKGTAKVTALVKEGDSWFVDLEATIAFVCQDVPVMAVANQPNLKVNLKINGYSKTVYNWRFPVDYATGPVKSGCRTVSTMTHAGTIDGNAVSIRTDVHDSWSETTKYVN